MSARHRQAKKQRATLVEECDRYRRLVDAYSLVLSDTQDEVDFLDNDVVELIHRLARGIISSHRWVEGEIATHDALHDENRQYV